MELLLITGVLLFVIIAAADVLGPRLGWRPRCCWCWSGSG